MQPVEGIASRIHTIRGRRVLLDADLALLYGVSAKRFNEQVRRNLKRFPADFMFQLENQEFAILRSQFATSSWGGRRYPPFVFTEHGAIMAASIRHTRKLASGWTNWNARSGRTTAPSDKFWRRSGN